MLFARRSHALAALLAAAMAASCNEPATTAAPAHAPAALLGPGPTRLLECPTTETLSASGIVGPLGGTIAAGRNRVVFPAGAVLLPTRFTLTVPASRYVEIRVAPEGGGHFVFPQLVTVTIDYARCPAGRTNGLALGAWYIDEATRALLESMGGVDDRDARTVTFGTGHFSGYAIAY